MAYEFIDKQFFISPSTQSRNAYANGTNEMEQMNKVADVLCAELDRHNVGYARNNRNGTYKDAIRASNAYGALYHVAIHSNAGDGNARGCEVFCFNPANKGAPGTQLAERVYAHLSAITPTKDRGIKSGIGLLSEITQTNSPAILGEVEFHDKLEGAEWICSHIDDIAHAYLMGMLEQIGREYIPKDDSTNTEEPTPVPSTPVVPAAPATIVVGGNYSLAIMGNTSSDATGKDVVLATIPCKCIKIAEGTKNPYGMDYKGDGFVGAWFPKNVIKV